jgi:two-component system OmpR family sensor kinase
VLSIRRRLALAHAAAVSVVLGIAAISGYWALSRTLHGQLDGALLALADTEAAMLADAARSEVRVHDAAQGHAPFSFARIDRLIQIVDAEGNVIARSANLGGARLPAPAALLARLQSGETVFQNLDGFGEEAVRVVSEPVGTGPGMRAVQVAGSLDDVNQAIDVAAILFLALGAALVAGMTAVGDVLTRGVFRAIDELIRKAQHIGRSSLHERLPHFGADSEVRRLVDTLNAMLQRIESVFEVQRRFTLDASHELRTPLSRLRTEMEVVLRRPRSAQEYVQALRSCVGEVERLTTLVEALLLLARLDASPEHPSLEVVSLNEVAVEATDRLLAAARDRRIEIRVASSAPVQVRMARSAAALVLSNLLDNAMKYAPAGSRVVVACDAEGEIGQLTVADDGPGLRPEEIAHVFDRFFRGSAAQAGEVMGFGIGLALTRAILVSHGGTIEAANDPRGGARFVVRVPLVRDADR